MGFKVCLINSRFAEHGSQSIEMQISVLFQNADKGNGILVTALPVQQQCGSITSLHVV